MLLRPVVCTLAMMPVSALAVAPTDSSGQGIEPNRMVVWEPHDQAALRRGAAWRAFTASEGAGWRGTLDPATGTPHRVYGPSLPIGPVQGDPSAAFMAWVEQHDALLGASGSAVRLKSSALGPNGTWYVDVDVLRGGAPIWRGGLTARIKGGRLMMFGADSYPEVPLTGAFTIRATDAATAASAAGPAQGAAHELVSVEAFVLPFEDAHGALLRPVWVVATRTSEPPGRWFTFVDATSGEVVTWYNEVRYTTISGEHHNRTVNEALIESPMPLLEIQSGGSTVYADEAGFTSETDEITSRMRGAYVTVDNRSGSDASFSYTGDATWTTAVATQAEISSYVFLHRVRDWCLAYTGGLSWCTDDMTSNVNVTSGTCNAYWDGEVNFYSAGGGCNNSGQIGDVNYHEWGHGFHYYSIRSGGFDGSLSEGAADTVAFLQTDSPEIGPYFFTNGAAIREVSSNMVYPDDYVNNDAYVHSNGLIFGGTFWDLWHLLRDDYGDEVGLSEISRIFAGTLAGGPNIADSFAEALVGDDDDGDIGNGTPNYCAIVEAFDLHGLAESESITLGLSHEPIGLHPADLPILLEGEVGSDALACLPPPDGGVVHYRVDGGAWEEQPIELSGILAELPAQPLGAYVEYWFELDGEGGVTYTPSGGQINPFSMFVGDVLEVWCTDLEDDDGGFTHTLLEGEDVEGADDWQWGEPLGASTDPSSAASGGNVWGNDLGDGNYNGEYQNEKHNRLTGPTLDLLWYRDTLVQYDRWLGVEDGYFDHANVLANDEVVWSNWATDAGNGEDHHLDGQWMPHSVPLGDPADGSVAVSFEIVSDQGLAYGGWTIDDVCVYAPATADNRLGINDFVATDDAEAPEVALSWTHPRHAPVEQVVVVRRADRYPTAHDDGDVVYTEDAPEPGATVEAVDPTALGTFYYAVYGFDGAAWLSWTVEGWNADQGAAAGTGEDPDPTETETETDPNGTGETGDSEGPEVEETAIDGDVIAPKGCGCDQGGSPVPAALGALGVLALRRRRA